MIEPTRRVGSDDARSSPALAVVRDADRGAVAMRLEPLACVLVEGLPGGTQVLMGWPANLPAAGCGRCEGCTAFPFLGGRACLVPEAVARG